MELNDKELEEYNRLNEKESKSENREKNFMKDNMTWILIVLLCVMQLFLSCLSTVNGTVEFVFPSTVMGWVLLVGSKLAISVVGYMIWSSFFDKGKSNAYKTEEYKKSQEILRELQKKSTKNIVEVVNPIKWERDTKIKKGIKLMITLFITAFLLYQLVVMFSVASLIASILSLLMSLFWGYQMMNKAEEVFSTDYLKYALLLKAQYNAKEEIKEFTDTSEKGEENV